MDPLRRAQAPKAKQSLLEALWVNSRRSPSAQTQPYDRDNVAKPDGMHPDLAGNPLANVAFAP